MAHLHRIMIIGSSGSGKSTLAKRLGEMTALPVIHMDHLYWCPGWVLRSQEEIEKKIAEIVRGETWIIEGNNSATFWMRSTRADMIILLDIPRYLCLWRVILRSVFGKPRPDLPPECSDRLTWALMRWVWGYPKKRLPVALRLLEETKGTVARIRLHSAKEVDLFLEKFQGERCFS